MEEIEEAEDGLPLSFYQGDDKKSIEKEIKKIIKAKEEISKIVCIK